MTERLIHAKPLVANRGGNAVLFERFAEQVMTPVEVTRKNRKRRVRVGERAAFVPARPAEKSRGEPELMLDELRFVFSREEKPDHHVVEEAIVERLQDAPEARFAADVVKQGHGDRLRIVL